MAKHVEPSTSLVSFSCPHCGAHAHQTWYNAYVDRLEGTPFRSGPEAFIALANMREISGDARREHHDYLMRLQSGEVFLGKEKELYRKPRLENVSVSRCYSCDQLSVWVNDRIVDPEIATIGIAPNDDLSEDIKADFHEAALIVSASPRGAAALLRLCIQKLCIQLGEPGENLNTDIASLVSKKGLDPHIQQALDIVRVVGNNAVHPGVIDLNDNRDTAVQLFELVNGIADDLVTRPARLKQLYEKVVPEADRNKIAKRDRK